MILYQNSKDIIKIEVCSEEETLWLSQVQRSDLFDKDKCYDLYIVFY
jgi:hypothetical protein